MDKQVNLTINFPDADTLTKYCKATGWSAESGITKKDWVKEEIIKRMKATIEGYEMGKIEQQIQEQRLALHDNINNLLIN